MLYSAKIRRSTLANIFFWGVYIPAPQKFNMGGHGFWDGWEFPERVMHIVDKVVDKSLEYFGNI